MGLFTEPCASFELDINGTKLEGQLFGYYVGGFTKYKYKLIVAKQLIRTNKDGKHDFTKETLIEVLEKLHVTQVRINQILMTCFENLLSILGADRMKMKDKGN